MKYFSDKNKEIKYLIIAVWLLQSDIIVLNTRIKGKKFEIEHILGFTIVTKKC